MSSLQDKIKNVIRDEINPILKLQMASAEYVSFAEGLLTIKLMGGCSGCPSSSMSLFAMISPIIKEKIPEIEDIILD